MAQLYQTDSCDATRPGKASTAVHRPLTVHPPGALGQRMRPYAPPLLCQHGAGDGQHIGLAGGDHRAGWQRLDFGDESG